MQKSIKTSTGSGCSQISVTRKDNLHPLSYVSVSGTSLVLRMAEVESGTIKECLEKLSISSFKWSIGFLSSLKRILDIILSFNFKTHLSFISCPILTAL